MKYIRIMVVEVNQVLREGLKSVLSKQKDFIIKSSANLTDATKQSTDFKPDVILLNPVSPGIPEDKIIRSVMTCKKKFPYASIVTVDVLPDNSKMIKFIKAGSSGFILRDATINDIVQTIRKVSGGNKVFPGKMTDTLFSQITSDGSPSNISDDYFTKREQEIINLIAKGMSNKEIARDLHISYNTVKSHIHNILDKLSLQSRVQLAKYAKINKSYVKKDEKTGQ